MRGSSESRYARYSFEEGRCFWAGGEENVTTKENERKRTIK